LQWTSLKANVRMYRAFLAGMWRYRHRLKRDEVWIQGYAVKKGMRVNPHWMMRSSLKISRLGRPSAAQTAVPRACGLRDRSSANAAVWN